MARLVVSAAVGIAVGWVTGNPQAGFAAFSATYGVSGFLDPAQKSRGPRLDDIKAPQASYGAPIPYLEGTNRVPGVFIWASDKREIATTEEVGGKGGPSAESTTYTYEIDVLYMVSANPIAGVRRIWSNGKLVWSIADDADDETRSASEETEAWTGITVYTGASDQLPDPIYEAAVGVGNAPAYRGRGTVMIEGLQLGGSGQLPVLTFEVVTDGEAGDANTRVQTVFDGGDPSDVAAYDIAYIQDVDAPNTIGYSDGAATFNSVEGAGACALYFDSAYLVPAVDRAVLIEGFMQFGESLDALAFIPVISYYPNASSEVSRLQIGYGGVTGWGRFETETFGQEWSGFPTPLVGRVHFAIQATVSSGTKVFIAGQQVYSNAVNASGLDDSGAAGRLLLGAFTSPGDYDFTVSGVAVRFEEKYTANFSPPTELDPPDGLTLTSNPAALDQVVSRACLRTGLLTAGDIDVTALAGKNVRGMAVSQVTTSRAVLENLMRGYHFECVEGDKLKFVLLGGASALTVPYEDLGCYIDGEPPEPLPLVRRNDIEQPSRVTVKFANALNDYQDGAESSERLVTDSTAEDVIELPIVFSPQEAKRIADVRAMEIAVSNLGLGQIALDNRYAKLEPTDVITLTGESGSTYRARIVKASDAAGLRTIDAVIDDATAINSEAVTDESYTGSTVVRLLGDTDAILIDGPLLRDADDTPGFYGAFGAEGSARWPGGGFYESLDGTTYTKLFDVTSRAIYGTTQTVLGAWTGGAKFDQVNTVRVQMNGTLSSVTRDAILNDRTVNAFAIGVDGRWEVIQAQNATLVSEGTYDLSGLLRGRRGTDHDAMSTHAVGDWVVKLQTSGMRSIDEQTSDIGVARYWKGVTFGKSISATTAQQFTPDGVRLKPWAPVDARASRASSGTTTIDWKRRTRYACSFTGTAGIVVPLGETSESYEVDVYTNSAFTTVARTLTSSTSSVAYSATQQETDFGSVQDALYVKIYQMSATVGRGYPLTATLGADSGVDSFTADSLNPNPKVLLSAGDEWLACRDGSGQTSLGFYTYATDLNYVAQATQSASNPYTSGSHLYASDATSKKFVLLMRGTSNVEATRKLFYGTLPAAPVGVVPSFMPANPPIGMWWTGSEFRALLVDGTVWSSPTGAVWTSEGATSGLPAFTATLTGAYVVKVGSALAMKFETSIYHCSSTAGLSWSAALGDVATFPTATYSDFFAVTGIASNGSRAVLIAVGKKPSDYNKWGIVYTTTDGQTWTEVVEQAFVDQPAYYSRSSTSNGGVTTLGSNFLCDLWPIVAGSDENDVIEVHDFGDSTLTFAYRVVATNGHGGSTLALARGNGTTGFDASTVYRTSGALTTYSPLDWDDA
jgi:hypothetical protein